MLYKALIVVFDTGDNKKMPIYLFGYGVSLAIVMITLGVKYLVFSPLVLSKREKNILLVLLSLYFFSGSVFTFQFLNDKIHNYVKKVHLALSSFKNRKVNTLSSKNIQTETKLSQFVYFSLVLREQEEAKTKYSAPSITVIALGCLTRLAFFFFFF